MPIPKIEAGNRGREWRSAVDVRWASAFSGRCLWPVAQGVTERNEIAGGPPAGLTGRDREAALRVKDWE